MGNPFKKTKYYRVNHFDKRYIYFNTYRPNYKSKWVNFLIFNDLPMRFVSLYDTLDTTYKDVLNYSNSHTANKDNNYAMERVSNGVAPAVPFYLDNLSNLYLSFESIRRYRGLSDISIQSIQPDPKVAITSNSGDLTGQVRKRVGGNSNFSNFILQRYNEVSNKNVTSLPHIVSVTSVESSSLNIYSSIDYVSTRIRVLVRFPDEIDGGFYTQLGWEDRDIRYSNPKGYFTKVPILEKTTKNLIPYPPIEYDEEDTAIFIGEGTIQSSSGTIYEITQIPTPLNILTVNFDDSISVNIGFNGNESFELTDLTDGATTLRVKYDNTPLEITYTSGSDTEVKSFYYLKNSFIPYTVDNETIYLEGIEEDDSVENIGEKYKVLRSIPIRHNNENIDVNFDAVDSNFKLAAQDVLNNIESSIETSDGVNFNSLVDTVDIQLRLSLSRVNPNSIKYIFAYFNYFHSETGLVHNVTTDTATFNSNFSIEDTVSTSNFEFNGISFKKYPIDSLPTRIKEIYDLDVGESYLSVYQVFPKDDIMTISGEKETSKDDIDRFKAQTDKSYLRVSKFVSYLTGNGIRFGFYKWGTYEQIDGNFQEAVPTKVSHPIYIHRINTKEINVLEITSARTTDYIVDASRGGSGSRISENASANLPILDLVANSVNKSDILYDCITLAVYLAINIRVGYEVYVIPIVNIEISKVLKVAAIFLLAYSIAAGSFVNFTATKLAETIALKYVLFEIIDLLIDNPYLNTIAKALVLYDLSIEDGTSFLEAAEIANTITNGYTHTRLEELKTESEELEADYKEFEEELRKEFEDLAELNDSLLLRKDGSPFAPLYEGYKTTFAFNNIKPYTYTKSFAQTYKFLKPSVTKDLPYLRDKFIV